MTNYKITAIESKTTSTGKAMKTATLEDETGVVVEKVAIWSNYPDFANLVVGSILTAEIETKQNGQYINLSLKSPSTGGFGANRGGSGAITKAMEKKAENIEKAQENKNESIKIASTFASAVNCAIAEYNKDPHNLDTLEELIRKWRKVLWFLWEEHTDYPPFLK